MTATIGMTIIAAAVTVRPNECITNYVASGTSAQADEVFVSTDGTLLKTGEGKWSLPSSTTLQPQPLKMTVLNGSVSFPTDTVTERKAAFPEALKTDSRLSFWLDASDPKAEHFESCGAGGIERWFDVRETNVASPKYNYVKAGHAHRSAGPELMTTNGEKCVYFGGRTSGLFFNFYSKDGSVLTSPHSHVFIVHRVTESLGSIMGSNNGSASSFVIAYGAYSKAESLSSSYCWNSQWSEAFNGRSYLNGKRVDLCSMSAPKGLQLLEMEIDPRKYAYATSMYSGGSPMGKAGGDFLCEAIIFNKALTDDERIAVQNYLMDKWFGTQNPNKEVTLAQNSTLEADGVEKGAVVALGNGTIKNGGEYHHEYHADVCGDNEVDVNGGVVKMGAWMPVKASAGQTLHIERDVAVPKMSVANNAAANQLIKTGTNTAIICGVPEGVKRLDVKAGALFINAPLKEDLVADDTKNVEIPVGDGSFETLPEEKIAKGAILPSSYSSDWTCGSCAVYDYKLWTNGVSGVMDGAKGSAWGATSVPPPDGTRALYVRNAQWAAVKITLPSGGNYELTCYGLSRSSAGKYNGMDVTLTDTSDNKVAVFGTMLQCDYMPRKFHRYRFRAWVKQGGTYKVRFAGRNSDSYFMIDDIRMVRLANVPERRWQIPGGNFEQAKISSSNYSVFTNGNVNSGWTFTHDSNWITTGETATDAGRVSTGVSTIYMMGNWQPGGLFNNWQGLTSSFLQLLIRGMGGEESSKVVTTFTPPAGKHYLRALLAGFNDCTAGICAKIAIGGKTIDLGKINGLTKAMIEHSWPVPFEADGSTSATLTLTLDAGTSQRRGVFADDFVLSDRPTVDSNVEYVKNGNFESGTGSNWTKVDATGKEWNTSHINRSYGESYVAFGHDPDRATGGYFADIYCDGRFYQDVALPSAGRYRLSFMTRGRVNSTSGGSAPHPIRITVADGVTTSVVARTLGDLTTLNSTNWVKQVYDFCVPTAGTYCVQFRGVERDINKWRETLFDDISIRQVSNYRDYTPPFDEDAEIRVAQGAYIKLDFEGTNQVGKVRFGNRTITGVINAETHPEFVTGTGSLKCDTIPGMLILFR